jgi:hypothetical protein
MTQAVEKRVPSRFLELNKKAFEAGKIAARDAIHKSILQDEVSDEI